MNSRTRSSVCARNVGEVNRSPASNSGSFPSWSAGSFGQRSSDWMPRFLAQIPRFRVIVSTKGFPVLHGRGELDVVGDLLKMERVAENDGEWASRPPKLVYPLHDVA